MEILNGENISQEILEDLKPFFQKHKAALAAISIGDNSEGEVFIKQKKKVADYLSIEFIHFHFGEDISNKLLSKKINQIVRQNFVKGVILQLPLPKKFNTYALVNIIPPQKDIDVLNNTHFASYCFQRSVILPPAVETIKIIFEKYNINVQEKNCGVVGIGRLVGLPILIWLLQQKATVFAVDIFTKQPEKILAQCDIIITGTGSPHLINKKFVKKGAIIIDFGFSKENGKIKGDVDIDSVKKKTRLVTPTPGGTGPILVAALYKNLKTLIQKNQR